MEQKQKKAYPIKTLVNWYFGNYCVKKCYNDDKIQYEHWQKFQEFAAKNPTLTMTHKEFIEFFAKHMNICIFDYNERKRMPSWKEVPREECKVCKFLRIQLKP